jgi:phosphatidylglycerol:prolipoprotein diacylglycerol transferase
MCPELTVTAFGTAVSFGSYSLFSGLGAAAGVLTAFPFLKKAGLKNLTALSLLALMAVFFLTGARLLNFLFNPGAYAGGMHLTTLRFAGFSLYGGVLGALITLVAWAFVTRRNAWPLLDAFVLPSAAAFALARVGCFLNGCCSGKATSSPLGVVFPVGEDSKDLLSPLLSVIGSPQAAVWPTQLFEAGLALLGLAPALWLFFRKKAPPGTAFLVYGIWFTAIRWAILPLRALPYPEAVLSVAYPVLYGLLLLTAAIILLRRVRTAAR